MTDEVKDPVADVLKRTSAPWYVRLGWRMNKGEIMAWIGRLLNGNNRIIALLALVIAGAIKGLGGPDLTAYANGLLSLLGLSGAWLHDLGITYSPAEVIFWAYSTFAAAFALWKRWRATGQVLMPGGAYMPALVPPKEQPTK